MFPRPPAGSRRNLKIHLKLGHKERIANYNPENKKPSVRWVPTSALSKRLTATTPPLSHKSPSAMARYMPPSLLHIASGVLPAASKASLPLRFTISSLSGSLSGNGMSEGEPARFAAVQFHLGALEFVERLNWCLRSSQVGECLNGCPYFAPWALPWDSGRRSAFRPKHTQFWHPNNQEQKESQTTKHSSVAPIKISPEWILYKLCIYKKKYS